MTISNPTGFAVSCVVAWIVLSCATMEIAAEKGHRRKVWFLVGLALGPLGVAAAVYSDWCKTCPNCLSLVPFKATACRYCTRDLPAG